MEFYRIFFIATKLFVFAKVSYLLFMTSYNPELYPLSMLNWWIYFLIFDIWMNSMLPNEKPLKKGDNN
jgi:hypothetical protein